jgi:hypothetical protein
MADQNTTQQPDPQTTTSGSSNTSSEGGDVRWVTEQINKSYN